MNKNEIIAKAFEDVDQSKVDACQDLADEMRERLRGTNWEHEMLNGERCDETSNY